MKCLQVALLTILIHFIYTQKISFKRYKVFRITPANEKQFKKFENLLNNETYEFLTYVTSLGNSMDIIVSPELERSFKTVLNSINLKPRLIIKDIQALIDNENKNQLARSGEGFNWKRYNTLNEINNWLYSLPEAYPGIATVIKGGTSYNKRDILGVKISYKPGNKAVFLEGGIHAREWISPATVTYIANELLSSSNPIVQNVAKSRDWYIFPVFNPDGYVYTSFNRLWRKTMKPTGLCFGTDPNRNWNYKWKHGGSSSNPCAETYAGNSPFSEIEIKSLSQFITSISDELDTYIAFHSYGQMLLHPFGDNSYQVATNREELHHIGTEAINLLEKRFGTRYKKVGSITEVLNVASGSSIDWVLGTFQNVRFVYAFELRDNGTFGFILPADQIIPTGEETMTAIVRIFQKTDNDI